MLITANTRIEELNLLFPKLAGQFITGKYLDGAKAVMTLSELQENNPTWNADDMLVGLHNLMRVDAENEEFVFSCGACGPVLIWLPAEKKAKKPFVLLIAGGAYGAVCTLVEAMPVAAKLNELGYDCFCLNYRTATPEDFTHGLFPKPLDDVAAAIRFIDAHDFKADIRSYDLVGFSAGGHLAACWAADTVGAARYGLPRPEGLVLAYPLVSMACFADGPVKEFMCKGMFGSAYTAEDLARYDARTHLTDGFPKTYLVRCADDDTVTPENGDSLAEALTKTGVPFRLEEGERGGHGFGLGSATSVRGWVERAMNLMEDCL